jgi:hopanoid biosynthesis associated protein HpnK
MVGEPGAADAVARAKRLATLAVGLHVVVVDGTPVLPVEEVPALVDARGAFGPGMAGTAMRFALSPAARRQLAAEIRAQFEAFRKTGLPLDHVNGHKNIHLHPVVGRLVVEIGRDYGMRAVRLPAEPIGPLRRAFPGELRLPPAWSPAVAALRRRLRRAGLAATGNVFGTAWTGRMVEERVMALLPHLPAGFSEIYCHPGTRARVPGYRHQEELAALVSPRVRERIAELGIRLVSYADLAAVAAAPAAPAK